VLSILLNIQKYKLKNGKSVKTYTKKVSTNTYTISNTKSKDYGYEINVTPYWSSTSNSAYSDTIFSNEGYAILRGASKSKQTKIPVYNTQGKKTKKLGQLKLLKRQENNEEVL